MSSFCIKTFGKWILVGEHAVLRGCPALAFPLLSQSFQFTHTEGREPLSVEFHGEKGSDYQLLFHGVLEQALVKLNIPRESLHGKVVIDSSLPVGSGLGASAALSVAIGRWFSRLQFVPEKEIYEFSRGLEDLFHGESSGVDIAVSLKGHGIRFIRNQGMEDLKIQWQPRIYLSYSGSKGLTAECITKVKALFEAKPQVARHLDEQMCEAVEMAEKALMTKDQPQDQIRNLKTALLLGRDCFEKWGLVFGSLEDHMKMLDEAGALAVKPTGSGGGGFALSLWEDGDETPEKLGLISAF